MCGEGRGGKKVNTRLLSWDDGRSCCNLFSEIIGTGLSGSAAAHQRTNRKWKETGTAFHPDSAETGQRVRWLDTWVI